MGNLNFKHWVNKLSQSHGVLEASAEEGGTRTQGLQTTTVVSAVIDTEEAQEPSHFFLYHNHLTVSWDKRISTDKTSPPHLSNSRNRHSTLLTFKDLT